MLSPIWSWTLGTFVPATMENRIYRGSRSESVISYLWSCRSCYWLVFKLIKSKKYARFILFDVDGRYTFPSSIFILLLSLVGYYEVLSKFQFQIYTTHSLLAIYLFFLSLFRLPLGLIFSQKPCIWKIVPFDCSCGNIKIH